jgi:hypothetical protein
MLGWLRQRSDGLVSPFLVHVALDIAIFTYGVLEVT